MPFLGLLFSSFYQFSSGEREHFNKQYQNTHYGVKYTFILLNLVVTLTLITKGKQDRTKLPIGSLVNCAQNTCIQGHFKVTDILIPTVHFLGKQIIYENFMGMVYTFFSKISRSDK